MLLRPHRTLLPSAGILAVGLLGAMMPVASGQTTVPESTLPAGEEGDESGGSLFSGGLLTNGSILKNVVLPSYDENLNLASTLNAGELKILTREEIRPDRKTGKLEEVTVLDKVNATDLRIRFFNPDRSPQGSITMARAVFEPRPKLDLLTTTEPVSFVSDDLKVDGSALAYDAKGNRGFLHGPVTAVAKNTDLSTSMNATPARSAIAAGAMLMAAASAQEAAPQPAAPATTTAERISRARLSPAELEQLAADKASRAPQHQADAKTADREFTELKTESEDARITMNSFLQSASLAGLLAQPAPQALPDVPLPEALQAPDDVEVKAKDGAYFDSQEGILIFLGNVTVKSTELNLSGANEVKVFMEPEKKEETAAVDPNAPPKPELTPEQLERMKAAKAAQKVQPTPEQLEKMKEAKAARLAEGLKDTAKADKGGKGGKFGDAQRLVATGPAVRLRYLTGKPGDEPIDASAHTIVYDFKDRYFLLQGGSPWAYQAGKDGFRSQAIGAEAYILVYFDEDGEMTKTLVQNQGEGSTFNFKMPESDDKKEQKPKQAQPNR